MNSLYHKTISPCRIFQYRNISHNYKTKQVNYNNVCNWNSDLNLMKHLSDNVVYVDKTFLAISKPWGLPMYHRSNVQNDNMTRKKRELLEMTDISRRFPRSSLVLSDTLPYFANICKVPRFHIARCKFLIPDIFQIYF